MISDGQNVYFSSPMEAEMYLAHHGIKGQKWGQRRFQNADGSLTNSGRQRYGVIERTKIRMRGVGQDIRSTAKAFKEAKGVGNKASELFGYGRMKTYRQNKSRVEEKLKNASRTRLGKAIHRQRQANNASVASYAEAMKHKSAGEKFMEQVIFPSNALNVKYTRLSGRETTVGKQVLDSMFTGGTIGAFEDVRYLSAQRAKKKAQQNKPSQHTK